MAHKVRITPEAEADLRSIGDYIVAQASFAFVSRHRALFYDFRDNSAGQVATHPHLPISPHRDFGLVPARVRAADCTVGAELLAL